MEQAELNSRVRAILQKADHSHPGLRSRAERVAVYAVATGQRLGMDMIRLISLRMAAELQDIEVSDPELSEWIAKDLTSIQIIRLCSQFDARRSGYGHTEQLSDSACTEWLEGEARITFESNQVEALLAVQNLIQPIGT